MAPKPCPMWRAVPSMPLAAPLRCTGAEVTIVWLLGDWNMAKPAPHKAMRHAMSQAAAPTGNRAKAHSPAANSAMPMAPKRPAGMRPILRPTMGATTARASGHALINKPAWPVLTPWLSISKNGMAKNAMVCALKAQMDAPIDSRKTGMRSKSSGSMGCACGFWRCTYSQPAVTPSSSHMPAHHSPWPGW